MTRASPALRHARSCYRHLAGELGVALRLSLEEKGLLRLEGGAYRLTDAGRQWAASQGLDSDERHAERHARACLDWTERQPHIGGRLGVAILDRLQALGLVQAGEGRALICTDLRALLDGLGLP